MGSIDKNSPRPPQQKADPKPDDADISTQDTDSEVDEGSLGLSSSASTISSIAQSQLDPKPVKSDSEATVIKPAAPLTRGRYSPEEIVKGLLAKEDNPMKHIFVLDQLVILDDVRFNGASKDYEFETAYMELRKSLQERLESARAQENKKTQATASPRLFTSGSKASLLDYLPPKEAELQSLAKELGRKLVGLVRRGPIKKPLLSSDGEIKETFTQKMSHVSIENDVARQVKGQTLSSELQKVYASVSEIANQGCVESNGRVIISRSARTDTEEKILKKSLGDILYRLQTPSKQGLVPILKADGQPLTDPEGRKIWEYARADVSFMDAGTTKALLTTGNSFLKKMTHRRATLPVESERWFLQNKRQAVENLWEDQEFIEHIVAVKEGDKEVEHLVRESKPMVFEFAFSSQANKPHRLDRANRHNKESNLRLFERVLSNPFLRELFDAGSLNSIHSKTNFAIAEPSDENLSALKKDLREAHRTILEAWMGSETQHLDKVKLDQLDLCLNGLHIALFGKDLEGKVRKKPLDSGYQFIYTAMMAKFSNSALSNECKSGNDRTGTGTALACAVEEFEITYGRPFHPQNSEDLKVFKDLFTENFQAFARPVVQASRGGDRPVIKVGSHPVFKLFVNSDGIHDMELR